MVDSNFHHVVAWQRAFLDGPKRTAHTSKSCTPPTAAVLSGGIAREDLENAGATAIYAGPLEVRAHLEEFSQLLGS